MRKIISVQNLSKRYEIGVLRSDGGTLRESLAGFFKSAGRSKNNGQNGGRRTIWALKDINFEVEQGELIGIVGRNGAGKSTLLKILSRITEPTTGRADVYGRIGSLLEVGTGFHPELSGRENVYLNGSILGMKRVEIDRKFDEIVAFAEIEKFLDTSVKRYSSGMYMRLAFSVAAHLEPEILLVDEVLAVGDGDFQAKCLAKMQEVAREGRTVIYVSHNLGSVSKLCPRAFLLAGGEMIAEGLTGEVIGEYVFKGRETCAERIWSNPGDAPGNEKIRIHAVRIVSGGEVTSEVDIQNDVHVEIDFWNLVPGARVSTSIHLLDKTRVGVLASANMPSANLIHDEWFGEPHPVGLYRTSCTLPGNFLNEGRYHVNAIVLTSLVNVEAFAEEVVSFDVHETGVMRKEYGGYWLGVVRPKLAWQTKRIEGAALGEQGTPS
jgi:lipopolysaccharide transport system ATP-binding protein